MNKIYLGDYKNYLFENKFDFILADIPYNIGSNAFASNPQWWNNGNVKEGYSEKAKSKFFEKDENFNIEEMLQYIYSSLKENGKALLFCSIEELGLIIEKYKKYKFKKYTPLIFIKNNSAEILKVNMRVLGACEYGIILYKNKLGTFNNKGKQIKNWFNLRILNKKVHPNEKPIELLENLINLFTNEEDEVLDFCMGSGTTGIACINTKRNFTGIEIEEKYYKIAEERINGNRTI